MSRSLLASAAMAALLVSGTTGASAQQKAEQQAAQPQNQSQQQSQQQQMQQTAQGAEMLDKLRANAIVGMTIKAQGGQDIGQVDSVVRSGPERVEALIIKPSAGGQDQMVLERDRIAQVTLQEITVNMGQDQVAQLPRYKQQPQQGQQGQKGQQQSQMQQPQDKEQQAAQQQQQAQTQGPQQQQGAEQQAATQAQDLIGKNAYSAAGQDVGDVTDILVNDQGQPQAIIIDHGGWMGMGEKQIALKWNEVKVESDGVRIDMPEDQISQLPEYEGQLD